jgi:DNA-binding NtrC family response regulator
MNGPVALVVDEDNATRTVLSGALGRMGIRSIEAADSAAASVQLRRGSVRLLFVDLQLPERGAERLIALARSNCTEFSLVVMTRRPSLESAVEAVRMGACDYLVKPLTGDKIQTACKRAMATRVDVMQQDELSPATLEFGSHAPLAGMAIQEDESTAAAHGRRRFDAAVPAEMTVNVPLVGDFRKISQCLVREALVKFRGNKAAAARALGMHRKTLYRLLQAEPDDSEEA